MPKALSVVICTGPPEYPLNKQNWSLARALRSRGHHVTLVTDLQRDDLVGFGEHGTVTAWPSYHPIRPRDFAFIWRLAGRVRPDVILANFGAVHAAMTAGFLRRVPIRVAWYRSLSDQRRLDAEPGSSFPGLLTRPFRSIAFRLATHVVPVSEVARHDVCDRYGVRPGRCTVIQTRRPDPAEALGIAHVPTPHGRRIVCVGRLVPSKGQDLLLRAFARLVELEPEWPSALELIGDGPLREAYADLAERLGIRDRVELSGHVPHDEVFARAARADVMVVPFRTDAGPGVLAEGLGLGLPLVACGTGAMPELVGGSSAVRLVRAEDPEAMAVALRAILADASIRAAMSREARALFRREFHIDAWIAEVLQLLDDAAREARLIAAPRHAPLPAEP
jgi:glycosyltransferase involved in cell wall biosynthesis